MFSHRWPTFNLCYFFFSKNEWQENKQQGDPATHTDFEGERSTIFLFEVSVLRNGPRRHRAERPPPSKGMGVMRQRLGQAWPSSFQKRNGCEWKRMGQEDYAAAWKGDW